jgi:uncharacterized membrane protein YdjX (TVP38/TMEM64 family)
MKLRDKSAKRKLHHHLKEEVPHAVHKAKRIFSFKYPKLVLLGLFIILAYYLFTKPFMLDWISKLNDFSYLGIFVAGFLLAFGFTAPFSVGFLLNVSFGNIFLAAIIGTIGAVSADMFIFKMIKFSFMDEFDELGKTKTIKKIREILNYNTPLIIKHYLIYVFAGIMIATPLPDEIGVSMLAGLTHIKPLALAVLAFTLHFIVIFSLMLI